MWKDNNHESAHVHEVLRANDYPDCYVERVEGLQWSVFCGFIFCGIVAMMPQGGPILILTEWRSTTRECRELEKLVTVTVCFTLTCVTIKIERGDHYWTRIPGKTVIPRTRPRSVHFCTTPRLTLSHSVFYSFAHTSKSLLFHVSSRLSLLSASCVTLGYMDIPKTDMKELKISLAEQRLVSGSSIKHNLLSLMHHVDTTLDIEKNDAS